MHKNEEYKFHKERLDKAFSFIREYNRKQISEKKTNSLIDDTFLLSLNRHLQRKGLLTTKQHIALEEFMERWNMG